MEWLKKTAGKVKRPVSAGGAHSPSSGTLSGERPALHRVETGKFSSAHGPMHGSLSSCCALGGREDGTFGDNKDAAWNLKKLWKHYADYMREQELNDEESGSPTQPPVPELDGKMNEKNGLREADILLLAYLQAFNVTFGATQGGEPDYFGLQACPALSSLAGSHPESPGSTKLPGHPHAAVVGICKRLPAILEHVRACTTEAALATTMQRTLVSEFLNHLEILSRSEGNRDCMLRHDFAASASAMLQAACDGVILNSDHTAEQSTVKSILRLFMVFRRCVDPEDAWPLFVAGRGAERTSASSPSARFGARAYRNPLAHNVLRRILVSSLQLQTHIRGNYTIDHFALRIQGISAIAALCIDHASSVATILRDVHKGLDMLFGLLGIPLPKTEAQPDPSVMSLEYKCQLLCVFAFNNLSFRYPGMAELVAASGIYREGLAALLNWTASLRDAEPTFDVITSGDPESSDFVRTVECPRYLPKEEAPVTSVCDPPAIWTDSDKTTDRSTGGYPYPPLAALHGPLDYLLAVLEGFTLGACNGRFAEALSVTYKTASSAPSSPIGGFGSAEQLHPSSPDPTLAVSTAQSVDPIVQTFLAALATAPPKSGYLQYAFLRFLTTLLIESPADDDAHALARRRSAVLERMDAENAWVLLMSPMFYFHQTDATLRICTLNVVAYAAALPDLEETRRDGACRALLSLLSVGGEAEPIHDACSALCAVLRVRRNPVQAALHHLRAFDAIVPVVSRLMDDDEAAASSQTLHAVVALLQSLLDDNVAMQVYAFQNPPCFNLLFALLASNDCAVSEFAKRAVLDIAAVLVAEYPVYTRDGLLFGGGASGSPSRSSQSSAGGAVSTPGSSLVDQETTPDLLKRYFECFPVVVTGPQQAALQLRLLEGLSGLLRQPSNASRRTSMTSVDALRNALVNANALQFVLGVLSIKIEMDDAEAGEAAARALAERALGTIGLLLDGDARAKKAFARLRGYDEILGRACVKPGREVWSGLLDVTFRLLTGHGRHFTANAENNDEQRGRDVPPRIRNSAVVELLLNMYQHCPAALRRTLIARLADVAAASEANKAVLHAAGAFSQIMKVILPLSVERSDARHLADIMALLTAIAGYSLTVAEVKLVLQCLCRRSVQGSAALLSLGGDAARRRGSGASDRTAATLEDQGRRMDELPPWYDALVHTVLEIAHKQDDDLDFFAFEGGAGLALHGTAGKWPAGNTGWSFATWVRLDAVAENDIDVLSISTATGDGRVDIRIVHGALTIGVTRSHKQHFALAQDCPLQSGKWHSLVVSHSHPKLPWATGSDCTLYIDGAARWKGKLEFPESATYSTAWVGGERGTLAGQVASLYIFDDIISAGGAARIFAAGPARASQLLRTDVGVADAGAGGGPGLPSSPLSPHPGSSASASSVDLQSKVVLEIHPLATAAANENVSPASVVACGTKCLRTALHALGGVAILIPILAQVDLSGGALPPDQGGKSDARGAPDPETVMIRKLRTASFFDLLACVTARDPIHRNAFAEMQGAKLVAGLLQMNDSANLGVEVFHALGKFLDAVSASPELSAAVQDSLVFDARLWAATSPAVQIEYLGFVGEIIAAGPATYAKRFGAAFWIDILERWYQPGAQSAAKAPGDLAVLRAQIIDLIKTFLAQPLPADLDRLLRTLAVNPDEGGDDTHVVELLQVVLEMGARAGTGGKFLERLMHHGAAHIMLHLLSNARGSGAAPVLALRCIAAMLSCDKVPDKWKRRLQCDELPWLNNTTTPAAGGPTAGSVPAVINTSTSPPGAAEYRKLLANAEFTVDVYRALVQLAIEERAPSDDQSGQAGSTAMDMRSVKVRNPAFFGSILALLVPKDSHGTSAPSPSTTLKCQVVSDLMVLASRPENGDKLRRGVRWQPAFLRLLPDLDDPAWAISPVDQDSARLKNLVFEALTTFTLDMFDKDRKAWRCVEDTVVYIYVLFEEQTADRVLKTFFERLLHSVRGELAGGDLRAYSAAKLENLVHVLLVVEEYMFHHHSLRDALAHEIRAVDAKKLAFLSGRGGMADLVQGDSRRSSVTATAADDVRISFPMSECAALAEECLELLTALLDLGVNNVRLEDNAEKSHTSTRAGTLVRLPIRILLSGLAVLDEATWHLTLRHLIPLVDKYAAAFSEGKKDRGLYVIGHVHEAYMVAQRSVSQDQQPPPQPGAGSDYRILLPLYMLVVSRWRESVATLSDGPSGGGSADDPPIIPEALLSEALADQDIFNHLVSSPVWGGVFDHHLFPVMRAIEAEQFAIVPLITKRFARAARHLVAAWSKDDGILETANAGIGAALSAAAWRRREMQVRARNESEKEAELDRRFIARELCSLWRTLTQERGIWHPYFPDRAGAVQQQQQQQFFARRWKLDPAENSLRMRRRLSVNWEFDSHDNAAAKRDKTFKPDKLERADSQPGASTSASSHTGSPKLSRQSTFSGLSPFERKRLDAEKLKARLEGSTAYPPDVLRGISGLDMPTTEEEPEEEWSVLNDDDLHGMYTSATAGDDAQRLLFTGDCEMILLMTPVKGRLEVSATHILFTADLKATAADLNESERDAVMALVADSRGWLRERSWSVAEVVDCYLRRYMLRRSAIELFFIDRTSCLFNFPVNLASGDTIKHAAKERARFLKALVATRPPLMKNADLRSLPADLAKRSNMTERWTRREISNFEYLMWLNTVSGRTYNDLTQYPVFPWIIRDFQSETLDLANLSIYRDLSKPIGALDEARLQGFLERYEAFSDPSGHIKKFHYGTHYSSAASVLFYLLRLEPFTALHIGLQSGKFDHPDRQFHSLAACWKSVLSGAGDVKELIPEFFYQPEFLVNDNNFNLGTKQTGEILGDVVLPPWAKTPDDFVRIHREALEGDYVSDHLHEWIDLIWGCKQTGDEAVKAHNVFYYLTYEGAINIDSVKDPVERRSIEDQINNFGQTPSQLFKKPHPVRRPRNVATESTLFTSPQSHRSYLIELKQPAHVLFVGVSGGQMSLSQSETSNTGGRLITVDDAQAFRAHRWNVHAEDGTFVCDLDQAPQRTRKLPFQLGATVHPHDQLYAMSRDGKFLVAGGCWDGSFRVFNLDSATSAAHVAHAHHHIHHHSHGSHTQAGLGPKTVDIVYGHRDTVTCLAISEDNRILVTGSRDTTVMAWDLDFSSAAAATSGSGGNSTGGSGGSNSAGSSGRAATAVARNTRKVFCGHDQGVTDVAIDTEHGLVVSGSSDGTVILHTYHDARYLRTLLPLPSKPEETLSIRRVLVSKAAIVVAYSEVTPKEHPLAPAETAASEREEQTRHARRGSAPALGNVCYLHAFTINGRLLKSRMFPTRLKDVKVAHDGEHLVAADDRGGISLLKTHSFNILHRFDVSVSVSSVSISHDQRYFFLGRKDGRILVLEHDAKQAARVQS
ncbi:Neurobeachin-like protein 1 [Geranomyces variabilis]|uniref:Beige protein homolog 1 n=1 Tax=Geranomyces variabilis TaxID=109894 RepID=A0AAD5XQ23_9FUNG|nr:Neurobeachin-like protein 1 [Geranomyces variabilis]